MLIESYNQTILRTIRPKLMMLVFIAVIMVIVLQACSAITVSPNDTTFVNEQTDTDSSSIPIPNHESGTQDSEKAKSVAVEVFAKKLNAPWALSFAPDGRLFFTESSGTIQVISEGVLQEPPYMQIEVARKGEAGLLGIAIDPEFDSNKYIYVYHTYINNNGKFLNRIVRLTDHQITAVDPLIIIDQIPGSSIHNGGRIKFGPDQKLYISTGDAGSKSLSQDLNSLAGKILRINKDGTIPNDNPFQDSPIYSFGHRNPQGLAWHPKTNQLFATEHGPIGHDEVNLIQPGLNYGWPEDHNVKNKREHKEIAPVLESGIYTWAPSGAAFCTSDSLPETWKDRLLFGTLRAKRIIRITFEPPNYQRVQNWEDMYPQRFGRIRDIVQGTDGYMYFSTSNLDGRGSPREGDDYILRIVPVTGTLGLLSP
ncbi:PQQ-dependent sugar dehydrogenase [SAR202 cluster bacterium AC-409-J13_OGT_754m]|nr:PQQ-dependent sugar dehydrogenase [SAR202 cluster bacterium AC-409-J13_OGT_754m]